jgi:hypothetical protein
VAGRRVGFARAVVARNFGRAAVLFPPRKLRASAVPHSQQHRRQKGKEAAEVSASTHARAHARERASERVVFLAASRCCRREHSQPSLDSYEGAMLASHPLPPQWPHFFGQQASLSLLRIPPAAWHSFSGTSVLFPLVELPVGGCFSNATPKPSVSFSVLCLSRLDKIKPVFTLYPNRYRELSKLNGSHHERVEEVSALRVHGARHAFVAGYLLRCMSIDVKTAETSCSAQKSQNGFKTRRNPDFRPRFVRIQAFLSHRAWGNGATNPD